MTEINHMVLRKDLKIIDQLGLNKFDIKKQIDLIKNGNQITFKLIDIVTLNNGILSLDQKKINDYIHLYSQSQLSKVKFVPASGAATRMFQELSSYLSINDEGTNKYLSIFMENIKKFAFYNDLKQVLRQNDLKLDQLLREKEYKSILMYLLTKKGLNYAHLPKGLIKFHQYSKYSLTAFEEHLTEGSKFLGTNIQAKTITSKEKIKIHLTINKDSRNQFSKVFKKSLLQEKNKIEVSFSTQKASTNMIALNEKNQLVRDEAGYLIFRQAGHGALIQNLNRLASKNSIIFIKNIDNIVKESQQKLTVIYHKAFAGLLIQIQKEMFQYLHILTGNKSIKEIELNKIFEFCINRLNMRIEEDFKIFDFEKKIKLLIFFLNKPLRICGLVKNSGQTGGLPFWVKDIKGNINLQIIEGSQLDQKSRQTAQMIKDSTHFNPVFMVCGVKDFRGKKFNLLKFINHDTRIITHKSYQGKMIKVMELPGLWNGSMYYWNTIFIEMKKNTFAPVKSVMDLLDKRHL